MKKHVRKHLHPVSFGTIGHLHDNFLNRIPSRRPANKDSWDFLTQNAQCIAYLPTFIINLGQMEVNIPYIEHLGYFQGVQNFTDR